MRPPGRMSDINNVAKQYASHTRTPAENVGIYAAEDKYMYIYMYVRQMCLATILYHKLM